MSPTTDNLRIAQLDVNLPPAAPSQSTLADNPTRSSSTPPPPLDANATELIPLSNLPSMSSPRTSRPMAISGPSSSAYKLPRRSSSSIRRPRQESISSSTIPYDPDTYTD